MLDPSLDLERRITALENEFGNIRKDVIKYTEHCITLMKAMTALGVEMKKHGMSTEAAAQHMQRHLSS